MKKIVLPLLAAASMAASPTAALAQARANNTNSGLNVFFLCNDYLGPWSARIPHWPFACPR